MELRPIASALPQTVSTDAQTRTSLAGELPILSDSIELSTVALLKSLLEKSIANFGEQELLLESLPAPIQTAAREILQANLPNLSTFSDGFIALLSSRRLTAESLSQLATQLQLAATLVKESPLSDTVQARITTFSQRAAELLLQIDANQPKPLDNHLREQIKSLLQDTVVPTQSQGTVQTAARDSLPVYLPNLPNLSDGFAALLGSRRLTAEALGQLATQLQLAATLSQEYPLSNTVQARIATFVQLATEFLLQLNVNQPMPLDNHLREQIKNLLQDNVVPNQSQAQIETTTREISQATLPNLANLSDGFVALLGSRRLTAEVLGQLANQLHLAASLVQEALQSGTVQARIATFVQLTADLLLQLDANIPTPLNNHLREQIKSLLQDNAIPNPSQDTIRFTQWKQTINAASHAVPESVRQLAEQYQLPELPELFVAAEFEKVQPWLNKQSPLLEQSAEIVQKLAESINSLFRTESSDQGHSLIFSLQMPLMNGEVAQQPIHIQVHHEKRQEKSDGQQTDPETWIRLVLQPENTGQVNVVFHLYGDSVLDIKVEFGDKQVSQLFYESVNEIREACAELPFTVGNVTVV